MRYIFTMLIGLITFYMAIVLQGLPIPQDGMAWVWNLGCSSMGLGGILLMFGPIVAYCEKQKTRR